MINVEKVKPTGLFTNYIYKAIPLAFDESLSYYETLCGLLDYLQNTVIPALNNNADAIIEVQNLVSELQTYVNNYFDNLDVQEEINNKLDAMVEDGTLQEIIADYLNSKAVFGFDNVASMKTSTNLIDGSYAETLGYHTKNDGGNALYKIRTITNDDVVDESFIIALNDNTLIAELVIDNNINVKKLGAYGDNTHDDTSIFNKMLNKLNKLIVGIGTYKISETLTISNKTIDIKGSINYTGEDYFLLIKQLTYSNIYIENFSSTNGGMIKIYPDVDGYVSFTNIYCKYAYCNKEVIRADATNGIITTMILDGIRWHSTINGCIKLYIGENANNNAFLTEINIKNMDLWSNVFGVDAENNSNNVEIQFNVYELDIENCSGIQTTGKITALGIYNCRLFEATGKAGWLTINNYCPDYCVIQGNGFIYPSKILWNNTTNNKPIETNMTIIDEITTYNYEGGGILRKGNMIPKIKKQVWKDFTEEIENHRYTLSSSKLGGLYNYFQTSYNAWLEFYFPNNENYREFYIQTSNAIGMTFSNGTASRTLTYEQFTAGIYKIYVVGNNIMYTKLS